MPRAGVKRSESVYLIKPNNRSDSVASIKGIDRNYSESSDDISKLSSKQSTTSEASALNMSLSDCTCAICFEILIEPVQFPCQHEMCLPCYKTMLDMTNMTCPMCRMRISNWSRHASGTNSLINQKRWQKIQKLFPTEIRNRLEGKTAKLLAEEIKKNGKLKLSSSSSSLKENIIVATPGEINKEYMSLIKREEERLRAEREQEEKLSLQYIQELVQQEDRVSLNEYLALMNRPAISSSTETVGAAINNNAIRPPLLAAPSLDVNQSQLQTMSLQQSQPNLLSTGNQATGSSQNLNYCSILNSAFSALPIVNQSPSLVNNFVNLANSTPSISSTLQPQSNLIAFMQTPAAPTAAVPAAAATAATTLTIVSNSRGATAKSRKRSAQEAVTSPLDALSGSTDEHTVQPVKLTRTRSKRGKREPVALAITNQTPTIAELSDSVQTNNLAGEETMNASSLNNTKNTTLVRRNSLRPRAKAATTQAN
jgi:E3 ubiquitin-protein ligase RNF168